MLATNQAHSHFLGRAVTNDPEMRLLGLPLHRPRASAVADAWKHYAEKETITAFRHM